MPTVRRALSRNLSATGSSDLSADSRLEIPPYRTRWSRPKPINRSHIQPVSDSACQRLPRPRHLVRPPDGPPRRRAVSSTPVREEPFVTVSRASGSAYRRQLSASVITPAATTTITMTVASASIEARVSYQLFQSSSMRWSLSKARPALRKFHCVERTCLCDQKCNATFRRARFDRAATWEEGIGVDLACRRGIFRGWRQLSDAIAAPSTNALKQNSWYRIRVTRSARSAGLR